MRVEEKAKMLKKEKAEAERKKKMKKIRKKKKIQMQKKKDEEQLGADAVWEVTGGDGNDVSVQSQFHIQILSLSFQSEWNTS